MALAIPSPRAALLWWLAGGKSPTEWHQYKQPMWRLLLRRYLIGTDGKPLRDADDVMRRQTERGWQYRRETEAEEEDRIKGEIW